MLSYGGTPLACAAIAFEVLPYNFRSKWIITIFPLAFSRGNIMGTYNADAFKLSQQTSLYRLIPCCAPNSICETRNKQLLREETVSGNGWDNQSMQRSSRNSTVCACIYCRCDSLSEEWSAKMHAGLSQTAGKHIVLLRAGDLKCQLCLFSKTSWMKSLPIGMGYFVAD